MNNFIKPVAACVTLIALSVSSYAIKSEQVDSIEIYPIVNNFKQEQIGSESALQTITLQNNTESAESLAISIKGPNASQFAIDSTTCTASLAANTDCTIDVKFKPTRFGSMLAYVDTGNGLAAFLSNDEDYKMGAKRRFPATLMGLKVSNGSTVVDITDEALDAGTTYTFEWTLLGYGEKYKSEVQFFACGESLPIVDNKCWTDPEVTSLIDAAPTPKNQNYWRYFDHKATIFTFSQSLTVPSSSLLSGENFIGLRFFYQADADIKDDKTPVSLIIPGNAKNVATDVSSKTGSVGNNGRRMFIKVTN